jgi:hypothetical protein
VKEIEKEKDKKNVNVKKEVERRKEIVKEIEKEKDKKNANTKREIERNTLIAIAKKEKVMNKKNQKIERRNSNH